MVQTSGNGYSLLDQTLRQKLASSLRPITKDEVTVFKGNERRPIISVESPAQARFSAHAIKLIGKCARARGLESRFPQALRALRGGVPGYLVFEPVMTYDASDSSLFELNWYDGNRVIRMNMIQLLQPRNLEVPKGFVSEMPVSLEELGGKQYIVIHSGDAIIRDKNEITEEEERTLLTATDDDLKDDPEDLAAPGAQSR